jgi:hypothetical protein
MCTQISVFLLQNNPNSVNSPTGLHDPLLGSLRIAQYQIIGSQQEDGLIAGATFMFNICSDVILEPVQNFKFI